MNGFIEFLKFMVGIGWLFPSGKPAREHTLMNIIATAYKDRANLAQALHDYANHFFGSRKNNLHNLANIIDSGAPLERVLSSVSARKLFSDDTRRVLTISDQQGLLETALIWRTSQIEKQANSPLHQTWILLWLEVIKFYIICSFTMIFIMPKYQEIFEGYDLQLPSQTTRLIDISNFIYTYFINTFAFPLLLIALLFHYFFRRFFLFYTFKILKYDPAYLYVYFRFSEDDKILLLNLMADAAEQNKPLEPVIRSWLMSEKEDRARRNIQEILADIYSGQALAATLKKHKFITHREAQLIESAQRVGNLPWMLRFIANEYTLLNEKFQFLFYRVIYWIIFIVMIIATWLYAIGMFSPIINLIHQQTISE